MKTVVKVNGGLGNQMFQYAMGRALSVRSGSDLLLDMRFYAQTGEHTHRCFELDLLHTHFTVANPELLEAFAPLRAKNRARALLERWFRSSPMHVVETGFPFNAHVTAIRNDVYLDGHWQSEKYFLDQEAIIREDFRFRSPLSPLSGQTLSQIRAEKTATSIHVRRGDYVHQAAASAFHGICPPGYYKKAMEHLQRVACPSRYFVFSDDMDWVKHNLEFDLPVTFVDHNRGKDSWQDMQLISACKNHIIANSSFSWWGAWLATGQKQVVAPLQWFRASGPDTRDLIPGNWLRL